MISALQGGKHQIKWRHCANLMHPVYAASIATDNQYVYVMGDSVDKKALNLVFVYTIVADSWSQLPQSDHCWGVLQMVGDKLTIFGGIDNYTNKRTNRVSTFDKSTQSWSCFYPDMIDIRYRPGVATYLEYVIVAGGSKDGTIVHNDIEVLNWQQRVQWTKSSVSLPVPMWAFSPIISDKEMYIVGYTGVDNKPHRGAYKIPVTSITSFLEQKQQETNKWINLPATYYYYTSLVAGSSPPVFIGGEDRQGVMSSNISIYDSFSNSWRYVDSLSNPRAGVAVTIIGDHSIIVVGGYTKSGSSTAAKLSSLPLVEIGQAELA